MERVGDQPTPSVPPPLPGTTPPPLPPRQGAEENAGAPRPVTPRQPKPHETPPRQEPASEPPGRKVPSFVPVGKAQKAKFQSRAEIQADPQTSQPALPPRRHRRKRIPFFLKLLVTILFLALFLAGVIYFLQRN